MGLATLPAQVALRRWVAAQQVSWAERTEQYEAAIAAYRSTFKRVLFLDFDGVLHPDPLQPIPGSFLCRKPLVRQVPLERPFQYLGLLADLLKEAVDVGLVVHSTWRHSRSHLQLRECLGPLRFRFLEGTHGEGRWASIQAWLRTYPYVEDYLVLDDEPDEFPVPRPTQLIVCPSSLGMSEPSVMAQLSFWLTGLQS